MEDKKKLVENKKKAEEDKKKPTDDKKKAAITASPERKKASKWLMKVHVADVEEKE
jgi:hypothetical protein